MTVCKPFNPGNTQKQPHKQYLYTQLTFMKNTRATHRRFCPCQWRYWSTLTLLCRSLGYQWSGRLYFCTRYGMMAALHNRGKGRGQSSMFNPEINFTEHNLCLICEQFNCMGCEVWEWIRLYIRIYGGYTVEIC